MTLKGEAEPLKVLAHLGKFGLPMVLTWSGLLVVRNGEKLNSLSEIAPTPKPVNIFDRTFASL